MGTLGSVHEVLRLSSLPIRSGKLLELPSESPSFSKHITTLLEAIQFSQLIK